MGNKQGVVPALKKVVNGELSKSVVIRLPLKLKTEFVVSKTVFPDLELLKSYSLSVSVS